MDWTIHVHILLGSSPHIHNQNHSGGNNVRLCSTLQAFGQGKGVHNIRDHLQCNLPDSQNRNASQSGSQWTCNRNDSHQFWSKRRQYFQGASRDKSNARSNSTFHPNLNMDLFFRMDDWMALVWLSNSPYTCLDPQSHQMWNVHKWIGWSLVHLAIGKSPLHLNARAYFWQQSSRY